MWMWQWEQATCAKPSRYTKRSSVRVVLIILRKFATNCRDLQGLIDAEEHMALVLVRCQQGLLHNIL